MSEDKAIKTTLIIRRAEYTQPEEKSPVRAVLSLMMIQDTMCKKLYEISCGEIISSLTIIKNNTCQVLHLIRHSRVVMMGAVALCHTHIKSLM